MNHLPAIEIYSIGTELLMGQIQDSNAYWMAQQIARLGGYVRRIGILDDELDEVVGVLDSACRRQARIVITSGGLGPTPDDLTVEAVSRLLGVEIEIDEDLVQSFMEKRQIPRREDLNPGLLKMATRPAGAKAHPNPAGVAPCVESHRGETVIYNIPGPPREVQAVFAAYLEEPIGSLYSGTRASVRVAVNLPESACGPILHQVMQDKPHTYLKALVALSHKTDDGQRLPVDVVARADSHDEAEALLAETLAAFKQAVGEAGSAVYED
jgi:nicotinamide-nucleotide amidase